MIPRKIQKWNPKPGFPFKCGIEIHTQLNTAQKLFSRSPNNAAAPPNENISTFDAALPGTFPKLNPQALLLALKAAAVLQCRVSSVSSFDRKHYFYLDQPTGYQITQHFHPLAKGGFLKLSKEWDSVPEDKTIGIEQLQLEQDTAKLNYDAYDRTVYMDLNRANVPLIELVTKPDFDHLAQVYAFVKKYIGIMSHLGVCSGELENGAMRCDVNVSVAGGNRVEIKNLGSTSEIVDAAIHEYARQVHHLQNEKSPIPQETRSWDGEKTVRTRSKEDAVDYRYVPDIELPAVRLDPEILAQVAAKLPELPEQLVKKLMAKPYGLEKKHARFLVDSPQHYSYYMQLHRRLVDCSPKLVNNWFLHELMGAFKKAKIQFDESVVSVETFASLVQVVQDGQITSTSAKLLLSEILQSPETAKDASISELVAHYDLGSVGEAQPDLQEAIDEICIEILKAHPDVVAKIKNGRASSINFLIGQAMKETQGKVSSKAFGAAFERLLT